MSSSDPTDIDKLLAQVAQSTSGTSAPTPATKPKASPARRDDSSPGGRLAFALIAAAVLGVLTWLLGVVLPFTAAIPMGLGGAIGAFLTALLAGPPRWFSS